MGATTFETYGLGKTPEAAFRAAREHAQYMSGHGGYTGTIAEKHGFELFTMPPRCSTEKLLGLLYEVEDFQSIEYMRESLQYARNKTELRKAEAEIRREQKMQERFWRKHTGVASLLEQIAGIYSDKWGPAVALEITGTKAKEIKKQRGRGGTHDRVFFFCGWASC